MNPSPEPSLRKRVDDFSYQVASSADPRFWFRLERRHDVDVVTDYFLGAFPRERAAALLGDCYKVLGLSPRRTLVFKDILPSRGPADAEGALDDARDLYAGAGAALLAGAGARKVTDRLEFHFDKYDLILVGE